MNLFIRLTLASSVLTTVLPAQGRTIRPGGATSAALHARQCENKKIEMLDIRPVAGFTGGTVPDDYLERTAEKVFFYFDPPEARDARYAIVRVVVHSDGTATGIELAESSRNDYFDREVRRALDEAWRGLAFLPFPPGVHSDSLPLELSIGRHAGQSKTYFAKRTVCPAWPKTSNRSPTYPVELQAQGVTGFVRARFMVDVTGRVRPATFQVLQTTNKQFAEAVRDILDELHYMPAEVQGQKVEQLTEQTFTFGFTDRLNH